MEGFDFLWLFSFVAMTFHVGGVLSAFDAVMTARSPQGAVAWALALTTVPYVALPAYWVLGRRRFHGYLLARRQGEEALDPLADGLGTALGGVEAELTIRLRRFKALEELARLPFTRGNDVRLLIDGTRIHDAILDEIAAARSFVLVQFYIIRDDAAGQGLARALCERAAAGVRVFLLYDEIGSSDLTPSFTDGLRRSGVEVHPFHSRRGRQNRFQINFRNHRKVVVTDGRVALVGGANVGDEYRGLDPSIGAWRDTHVRIEGPAAICVQLSFVEDWYWATKKILELDWSPRLSEHADRRVLVLPTGPADRLESCGLFFVHAINAAQRRIWIASPYFVPDSSVVHALQLAALRGVDVRILIPERPDHLLVWLAAFSFLRETVEAGVKVAKYLPGFLHQKVLLVDDDVAAIGTANLDNRSFRLNFELTAVVADGSFAREVEAMLVADFEQSRLEGPGTLEEKPWWFRLAARVARLFAPIL